MPRLYVAGAGLLTLLLLLTMQAPARLLQSALPDDRVLLQGLSGSLWTGSASRALVATPAGYFQLGQLDWSLRPWSLLLFSPSLDVESSWGRQTIRGRVTFRGGGGLGLRDFEASVSAELARQFLPVELSGRLSARLDHLLLRDNLPVSGEGQLVWEAAGWQSPRGQLPLGAYALEFSQLPDAPLTGQVITLSGPVRAEGTVELTGRSYGLDLVVGAEDGLDPQIEEALSLLASPEQGEYRLVLEGDF